MLFLVTFTNPWIGFNVRLLPRSFHLFDDSTQKRLQCLKAPQNIGKLPCLAHTSNLSILVFT
jgi:hypothetical protein